MHWKSGFRAVGHGLLFLLFLCSLVYLAWLTARSAGPAKTHQGSISLPFDKDGNGNVFKADGVVFDHNKANMPHLINRMQAKS